MFPRSTIEVFGCCSRNPWKVARLMPGHSTWVRCGSTRNSLARRRARDGRWSSDSLLDCHLRLKSFSFVASKIDAVLLELPKLGVDAGMAKESELTKSYISSYSSSSWLRCWETVVVHFQNCLRYLAFVNQSKLLSSKMEEKWVMKSDDFITEVKVSSCIWRKKYNLLIGCFHD